MKRLDFFNRMLPVVQDFFTAEQLSAAAMLDRWLDARSWGIVRRNDYSAALDIPVSPTAAVPNLPWNILEFPISLNTETGELSVGAGSSSTATPRVTGGVAYDVDGERIAIEDDLTAEIVGNPGGNAPIIQGNIDIPLTLTGITGGCVVNPAVLGVYYLWAEYRESADPTYIDVAEDGTTHYPRIVDNYYLRLTGTPTAPSGDGKSIFLAKISWLTVFPGTLTVFDGSVDQDGNGNEVTTVPAAVVGEPKRVYSLIRDRQVEAMVDTDNDRTQVYAKGGRHTVHDHVNAVGSADPSPTNPHGITLDDIPGGTSEPKATLLAQEGLAKGIVDRNLNNNSPVIQTSACQTNIENSVLIPGGLASADLIGTGITSATKRAWVRVSDLDAEQSVFVSGTRLKRLYPTLRESDLNWDPSVDPTDPDSGDGWVGFSDVPGSADPLGTYRIFGQLQTVNGAQVLLLRKVQLSDPDWATPALGLDEIELCQVYWDGQNLWRDNLSNNDKDTVERRSAGLVGPGQVSTDAKADPNIGLLSREVFANLVGNSAFQFNKVSGQFPGWQDNVSGGLLPSGNITQITYPGDTTLVTGGPGALTGVKLDVVGAQTSGVSRLYATIDRKLKPNRFYGISFWYKADSDDWNCRFRVGLNANNSGSNAPVITTGTPANFPLDLAVVADGQWHRASVVVQTKNDGSVVPTNDYYLEFRVDAPDPSEFPSGSNAVPFYLTNVQVTEGEWIPGYMGSHYVPSGAIILWDRTNTCPPGFHEVAELAGRMPIGVNAGGSNGMQTQGNSLGTQVSDGNAMVAVPNHTHNGTTNADAAGFDITDVEGNWKTPAFVNHTHTFTTGGTNPANATLPAYTLRFCRAD